MGPRTSEVKRRSASDSQSAIGYRTLESAADAEDVVQDAWIRWQGTDRTSVRDAATFLATTTKRLALNVADSAKCGFRIR